MSNQPSPAKIQELEELCRKCNDALDQYDFYNGLDEMLSVAVENHIKRQQNQPDDEYTRKCHELVGAVYGKDITKVKDILTQDETILNGTDFAGMHVLHYAINDIEILDFLLGKGANPNIPNGYGETPLLIAARGNNPTIVEKLIEKEADIYYKNKNNRNVLHTFCIFRRNVEILRLVIRSGMINDLDDWDQTPLDVFYNITKSCPEPDDSKILELLIQHGALTRKELSVQISLLTVD